MAVAEEEVVVARRRAVASAMAMASAMASAMALGLALQGASG